MPWRLEELGFRNTSRARQDLSQLQELPSKFLRHVITLIQNSPDPDQVLHGFVRLGADLPAFHSLLEQPSVLPFAAAIFGHSSFLSEAIIRHPEWLLDLAASPDLHRVLRACDYEERLKRYIGPDCGVPSPVAMASFRRREILRIVLRDVLLKASLTEVTEEISNLADAVLNVSLTAIRKSLRPESDHSSDGFFSVIALGKLGGTELNYSSDIDLMFIYDVDGSHPDTHLTHREHFKKVSNRLTELLSTYTGEGLCYRVDLRLRPDGRYGEVCQSLRAACQYYETRARDWELQMLIKARVAAGDVQPGTALLNFVEPLIYSTTTDFTTVEAVSETRQRIHEKLQRSRVAGTDIKLARGGIRDIEFLVQCLQRLHGGQDPWVRHGGTVPALFRLRDKGFISSREYSRLFAAYEFLRTLEHRLQFFEDRQTHTLPQDPEQQRILALRMPGVHADSSEPGFLERRLEEHLEAVRGIYERVVRRKRDEYGALAELPPQSPPQANATVVRFFGSQLPRFSARLDAFRPARGENKLPHFLEGILGSPDLVQLLENNEGVAQSTLEFFEHSSYFADQLIRYPALLFEVAAACGDRQGRVGFQPPSDLVGLRRFYREQMVRIQSDSLHRCGSVFKTLKRTSDLADHVISAAYRLAVAETLATNSPLPLSYTPGNQMMVIALGRLGMRELISHPMPTSSSPSPMKIAPRSSSGPRWPND